MTLFTIAVTAFVLQVLVQILHSTGWYQININEPVGKTRLMAILDLGSLVAAGIVLIFMIGMAVRNTPAGEQAFATSIFASIALGIAFSRKTRPENMHY